MALTVKRAEYYYATVTDRPGEAYKFLTILAERGVNLSAFSAIPIGPTHTRLAIFPEDTGKLVAEAQGTGLPLDGPHSAFLVQGDDELGALAIVHNKLYDANVNVYASSGVADGRGSFGYVLYVRSDDYARAAKALGL